MKKRLIILFTLFIFFTLLTFCSFPLFRYHNTLIHIFASPGFYISEYFGHIILSLFIKPSTYGESVGWTLFGVVLVLAPFINGLFWATIVSFGYYLYEKLVKKKSRKK